MGINISNHHSLLLPITTIKHFHFTSLQFTSLPLHLLLKINQSPKSIKMQSVIALTVAFLAAAVSATPYTATTTVQFTNDQSGRSANVPVALDGAKKSVATLLDNNYSFLATSFFLQSNFQGVECDLYIDKYVVTITEQHTFAGFAPVSAPKDLVHAEIACFKY